MKFWLALLALLTFLLTACGTTEQNGYAHLVKVKTPKVRLVNDLPVSIEWYRKSKNNLVVTVEMPGEFLLKRTDLDERMNRSASIQIASFANQFSKQELSDTTVQWFAVDSTDVSVQLSIPLPTDRDLYCKVTFTDLNKHVYQDFGRFILNSEDWLPIDLRFIRDEGLKIESDLHPTDSFIVKSYLGVHTIGPPPYDLFASTSNIQADTTFVSTLPDLNVRLAAMNADYLTLRLQNSEKATAFGLNLKQRENQFESIVYLLESSAEEQSLPTSWTAFWNQIGQNDPMKTERLKKLYLQRVAYADASFTSYKNGWMTDRGMIYIVMGPPDRIVDEMGSQIWSYGFFGETGGTFTFVRDPNNLHPKSYVLDRNETYFSIWQSARTAWLRGEVSALK